MDQNEYDKLSAFDFQNQPQDNPPINGVFSPEEELARIKRLPRGQKREALASFKENLARQREALAACCVFIERNIEFNHDVPRENLAALIEKFGAQYGFTSQQKQIAEQLIDGYHTNREKVLEMRERYQDDVALVNELTVLGFDKTSKLEAAAGPMSIDISADGFDARRIYQNFKDVVASLPYGGFATRSEHEDPLLYIVINKDQARKSTIPHEYEHQKNRLFREIFDKQVSLREENFLFARYETEQDPETKRELLETYFRLKRQEAFQYAKDEVIAMKKDRSPYSYDFFFAQDKSLYDYLSYVRDWEQKKDDALWRETAKRVLGEDYRKIFEGAVAAFDKLEQDGKYTREEVIAMLADKALSEWPKTARRLLEQKEIE